MNPHITGHVFFYENGFLREKELNKMRNKHKDGGNLKLIALDLSLTQRA